MVLGVTPGGYPLEQSFRSWKALTNDTLRSKIGLVVQKLFLFLFSNKKKPLGNFVIYHLPSQDCKSDL